MLIDLGNIFCSFGLNCRCEWRVSDFMTRRVLGMLASMWLLSSKLAQRRGGDRAAEYITVCGSQVHKGIVVCVGYFLIVIPCHLLTSLRRSGGLQLDLLQLPHDVDHKAYASLSSIGPRWSSTAGEGSCSG